MHAFWRGAALRPLKSLQRVGFCRQGFNIEVCVGVQGSVYRTCRIFVLIWLRFWMLLKVSDQGIGARPCVGPTNIWGCIERARALMQLLMLDG